MRMPLLAAFVAVFLVMSAPVCAQGAQADYDRAELLRTRFFGLVEGIADEPVFSADGKTLVYRRTMLGGGYQFVQVDVPTLTRGQAFDQVALARTLATTLQRPYGGLNLPFAKYSLTADRAAMEFEASNAKWRCKLSDYSCEKLETINRPPPPEGMGERQPIGSGQPKKLEAGPVKSPDGSLEAYIENFNLFVRAPGAQDGRQLSFDGAESAYYVVTADGWSPDSKMLAVSLTRPGEERFIHYIDSSPESQKQPILTEMYYIKPGDTLTDRQPVLFDVASGRATVVDRKLFPNAYSQSEPNWWKDGRGFYIRYNQRGHQAYRIIEVNRQGVARILIDEQTKTYIEYSSKIVFEPVEDGKEIVWMSERDGWCHLTSMTALRA